MVGAMDAARATDKPHPPERLALERAASLCGGWANLADRVGVTPQAVSDWDRTPPRRVLAVAMATGFQVTPHELDPDLYPWPKLPPLPAGWMPRMAA